MRRLSIALAVLLSLGGCSEPTNVLQPVTSLSIQDAVHESGNEHFFWLPPMVQAPAYAGTFDGSLDPVVHICEWDGAACVLPLVAEFTTTTGPGSETIRVEPGDEHYIVNWHTDEFALDPNATYRIVTSVDGQELGHADVDVVSSGNQLRNVDTAEYIALKDGRTLPIKFRIEEGAVSVAGSTTFVFDVTSGNGGVQGVGSQGPLGNEISVTIDAATGAATFGPYVHLTYTVASLFPPEILGVTVELLGGTGTYDFATGTFSGLEFVVRVTEPGGSFTDTVHTFSGSTTPALSVPAGTLPTGTVMQVGLSPSFTIALPGGYLGNMSFNAQVVSFTDGPA
jgi:hypothetical protein